MLHGYTLPGDTAQEREADTFAAEFLTPRAAAPVAPAAPAQLQNPDELAGRLGISADSLLYRCREVGLFSGRVNSCMPYDATGCSPRSPSQDFPVNSRSCYSRHSTLPAATA
ncbi:ImmA/IrrE family metallo-endopeptidase [Micromonospora sp. NBC_00389]|uniref:ImmA/IrrE family metallo-endopeptidase n=1 Tax=Micromonospora sp. NBC_00389 TaxID=2903586 RepID=UPI003FA5251F